MRSSDDRNDDLIPAGALLAIDAALAGEPADPEFAQLAELAGLLVDERPACPPAFAHTLDARVAARFAPQPPPAAATRRRWWRGTAGWSLGATAVVAALAWTVVGIGGGGSSSASYSSSAVAAAGVASSSSSSSASAGSAAGAAGAAQSRGSSPQGGNLAVPYARRGSTADGAQTRASGGSSATSATGPAPAPVPSSGRQIVQGAQLALSTAPGRVDKVSQEVFNVVGGEQGIVERSNVTADNSTSGGADFQLSIPSANLAATLDALSRLPDATVASRTDTSADITGQVGGAGMRLAEARALRASLLRQLAAATSATLAASLRAQIAGVDRTIGADEATLNGLHRQVAYSEVSVTISAVTPPVHHGGAGPFSLHQAAHDAGRVLVIVAGVGLIALAALLPAGLVVALLAWAAYAVRRRRREQALDLV